MPQKTFEDKVTTIGSGDVLHGAVRHQAITWTYVDPHS